MAGNDEDKPLVDKEDEDEQLTGNDELVVDEQLVDGATDDGLDGSDTDTLEPCRSHALSLSMFRL